MNVPINQLNNTAHLNSTDMLNQINHDLWSHERDVEELKNRLATIHWDDEEAKKDAIQNWIKFRIMMSSKYVNTYDSKLHEYLFPE